MSVSHKKQIYHVGDIPFDTPWPDWYSALGKQFGLEISYSTLAREDLQESHMKGADLIRFAPDSAINADGFFSATMPLISELHYVDLILRRKGVLWPFLLHKEAIQSVILEKRPQLNTKGAALIVGESFQALLGARTLIELGIKHVTFVLEDVSQGEDFLRKASHSLFEVQFEVISKDQVVLLPGIYSVMACYRDLTNEENLMEGLLYFSYLTHGGLVLMNSPMDLKSLREEASAIDAKVINHSMIQVHEAMMAFNKLIPLSRLEMAKIEKQFVPEVTE